MRGWREACEGALVVSELSRANTECGQLGASSCHFAPGQPPGSRLAAPSSLPDMRIPLLLGCLLVVLTGCGSISRLATARIEITAGTNRVVVTQPKDTVFKKLSYDPSTGAIEVSGYASAANAAAIAAQQAQTEAITSAVTSAMASAQASAQQMLNAYMGRPGAVASPATPSPYPQARAVPSPLDSNITQPFNQGYGVYTPTPNSLGYIVPNTSVTITPRPVSPIIPPAASVAKPPPTE